MATISNVLGWRPSTGTRFMPPDWHRRVLITVPASFAMRSCLFLSGILSACVFFACSFQAPAGVSLLRSELVKAHRHRRPISSAAWWQLWVLEPVERNENTLLTVVDQAGGALLSGVHHCQDALRLRTHAQVGLRNPGPHSQL